MNQVQSSSFVDLPRSILPSERDACLSYLEHAVAQPRPDKSRLLRKIPLTSQPSLAPISLLSTLLTAIPGQWPCFDVLCCYARLWKQLPEVAKARPNVELLLRVSHQVKTSYAGLSSLFPTSDAPAIIDTATSSTLSHRTLASFVQSFRLPHRNTSPRPTVALALPNGPLLGLAILATTARYTAAPLSVSSGAEQFRSDVLQSGASVILASSADVERLGLYDSWVQKAGIDVVLLVSKPDMTFTMSQLVDSKSPGSQQQLVSNDLPLNGPDDIALLLFTSGTSGTKKTVPITVHTIVCGIAFVIESWGLKDNDICLNMMPLFHVGGIIRNLFAPIMAGGSTICCPAFDPNLFWDIVEDHQPTWYYASPSMHSVILEEGKHRQDALDRSRIRLICNAAGGLLPSLACSLRDTFGCSVLPSYGMTECMPISSPGLDYRLDRPGTSGVSVGPEIGILDGNDASLAPGIVGRIAVRGAPVFAGYLQKGGKLDKTPFTTAGWFDTGDMGYLDQDGYLYVTGRSKEVINRGGELISPFEVEEAVLSAAQLDGSPIHGRVSGALAFSMPHNVLQEVVGIVLVTPPGSQRADIKNLHTAIKDSLNQVKWPAFVVYMDDLPKNNNKILRVKLAERLGLEAISDQLPLAQRHYEAVCPPPNTPLTTLISGRPCSLDLGAVSQRLEQAFGEDFEVFMRPAKTDGYPEAFLAPSRKGSMATLAEAAPAPSSRKGSVAAAPLSRKTSVVAISRKASLAAMGYDSIGDLTAGLRRELSDYVIPGSVHCLDEPLPLDNQGTIDVSQLEMLLQAAAEDSSAWANMSRTETRVAEIFALILQCSKDALSVDSDFFVMGGDSLRAGRLLSELRKEFQVRLPIDLLFTHGQVRSLSSNIDRIRGESGNTTGEKVAKPQVLNLGCSETRSSTNPFLLLLQLIPITLLYPMKRALTWTVFVYVLTATHSWSLTGSLRGRLVTLILSLSIGRAITAFVMPFFGIAMKWIIIGKFKQGMYPMWGAYHTRWWLVQKILSVCGRGHFGSTDSTLIWYYRLLGARIGKGVKISRAATLGEYDLLDIGDGANLDKCICRGFAAEQNTTMYLGLVRIGRNTSVGLGSVVAPGTTIPDEACIGPNSSSWEVSDADESNRDLSGSKVPGVHFVLELLLCIPVAAIVAVCRAGPWVGGLVGLVKTEPVSSLDQVQATIDWFAQPHRIGFHYLALILNACFGPMAWFIAVYFIKGQLDGFIGKLTPGPAKSRSQLQRLRMALLKKIVPIAQFHKLTELFGSHYEITSILYRAMGAKVGSRVYWPGTGPTFQDFDLLDIGDNVVFGSRSHLVTSDGVGSEVVRIGNGAMVSDRVILLPGASLGSHTVLGSGALTRRNKAYAPDTVWVGSKHGEAVCLSSSAGSQRVTQQEEFNEKLEKSMTKISIKECSPSESTLVESESTTVEITPTSEPVESSPFGRAFYDGQAPYYVFGLFTIFAYSSFTTIFTAFYWNVATTSSIQIIARLLSNSVSVIMADSWWRPLIIYALFTAFISALMTIQAILALAIVIASKWALLGRRQPGNYDWDKSPYCQRWQLFLTIEKLRRHCYGGHGILGLLTGTHYTVLYFRALGATIGKDCALFAGGVPSLMFTEPDLLTLGDRVSVDDASLVSHINSRGVFNLNPLSVGDRSVLRSGSRLLSGARMGSDAVLLEHTLIMAGDVVDDGCTMQGWPADAFEGVRAPQEF